MTRNDNRKIAFTLAEVLITLGIIGVVAALTMPALIGNYQKKQTVTKLKKAFTILNQASRMSYNDLGDIDQSELENTTAEEYFKKYWEPYIKYTKICKDYADCGYTSQYPFYNLKGDGAGYSFVSDNTRIPFYTTDGFLYHLFLKTSAGQGTFALAKIIVVDINGSQKPNVIGKDVFVFERSKEGFINTNGYNLTDEDVNNSCSLTNPASNASTSYCAEKIRRDGWEISPDYPW